MKIEEEAYLSALEEIPINPDNSQQKLLKGGGHMKFGIYNYFSKLY